MPLPISTMAADSPTPPPQSGTNWTAGRILLVVLGSIVALLAVGLLAAGGTLLWADRTHRDDDGFLTTPSEFFESNSYAITSEGIDLFEADTGEAWVLTEGILGDVRLTVEGDEGRLRRDRGDRRRRRLPRRRGARRGARPRLRPVPRLVPALSRRGAARATGGAELLGRVGFGLRRADRHLGGGGRPMDDRAHERRRLTGRERRPERRRGGELPHLARDRAAGRGRARARLRRSPHRHRRTAGDLGHGTCRPPQPPRPQPQSCRPLPRPARRSTRSRCGASSTRT